MLTLSKGRLVTAVAAESVGVVSTFLDCLGYSEIARNWVPPNYRPVLPIIAIAAFVVVLWVLRSKRPLVVPSGRWESRRSRVHQISKDVRAIDMNQYKPPSYGMSLTNIGDDTARDVEMRILADDHSTLMTFDHIYVVQPTETVPVNITYSGRDPKGEQNIEIDDIFDVGAFLDLVGILGPPRHGSSPPPPTVNTAIPLLIEYRDASGERKFRDDEYEFRYIEPTSLVASNARYEIRRRPK